MNDIVLGVAASHTTLMNTHWDAVIHRDRAERFRDALGTARDAIAAARPDVAVILGSNHFRGFFLDLMPAFTIGLGDCIGAGEAGTPGGPLPVDQALARHIADSLVDDAFDIAFSGRLQVDHGITHAIQYLLPNRDMPIIPVVINTFAPPLPSLARCAALGAAIARAIAAAPGSRRVVLIASGGLSHHLPWPDWRRPEGDDETFLVDAWLDGRANWTQYEKRRREIVLKATASADERFRINGAFDRRFLASFASGHSAGFSALGTADLQAEAGNGGQEIRAWLALAAALGHRPASILCYEEIPEWLTGMAVAVCPASD